MVKTNNKWFFEVSGISDSGATIFELTKITENSFVCENPQNEFPTHIQYQKIEGNLHASIWGGDAKIEFEFKPKQQ